MDECTPYHTDGVILKILWKGSHAPLPLFCIQIKLTILVIQVFDRLASEYSESNIQYSTSIWNQKKAIESG